MVPAQGERTAEVPAASGGCRAGGRMSDQSHQERRRRGQPTRVMVVLCMHGHYLSCCCGCGLHTICMPGNAMLTALLLNTEAPAQQLTDTLLGLWCSNWSSSSSWRCCSTSGASHFGGTHARDVACAHMQWGQTRSCRQCSRSWGTTLSHEACWCMFAELMWQWGRLGRDWQVLLRTEVGGLYAQACCMLADIDRRNTDPAP